MNLQFGILLQKKVLYYIVCIAEKYQIKIYCLQFIYLINFYDTSTALREQIYYKTIYYNCIVHNGWTISV